MRVTQDPVALDARIRDGFRDIIDDLKRLIPSMRSEETQSRSRYRASGVIFASELEAKETEFERVRTRALTLLSLVASSAPHITSTIDRAQQMRPYVSSAEHLLGILQGLQADYEAGLLHSLYRRVEAEVVADYLTMAEKLFAGERGLMRHVPAAVLAGAVLEDGLRRLCQRQSPPMDTNRPNGEPKRLNALIDELKAAGVYNELKAKQLRAWADIRNDAAHGNFEAFGANDVEMMLKGIGDFMADYL